MKTFWIRTASATVYAALTIFCIFAGQILGDQMLGSIILTAYCLFITTVGLFEFYRMAEAKGMKPFKKGGYLMGTVVCFSLGLWCRGFGDYLILLPAIIMCVVLRALWSKRENPFADLGVTLLGVAYLAVSMGLIPLAASSPWNEFMGSGVIMMMFIILWVNDSFAYIGGSLYGKHKFWPRHSPGKTWEGCATGLVVSAVAAAFIGPLLAKEVSPMMWVVFAVVFSVVGTLGDLAESMFKRSCGVKDSGKIMPGHGGILDRFDSVIACSPFLYLILFMFLY